MDLSVVVKFMIAESFAVLYCSFIFIYVGVTFLVIQHWVQKDLRYMLYVSALYCGYFAQSGMMTRATLAIVLIILVYIEIRIQKTRKIRAK